VFTLASARRSALAGAGGWEPSDRHTVSDRSHVGPEA
jgi:hypothetical protein